MNLLQQHIQTDQRFLIHGVDWDTYVTLRDALGDRHIFITYDGANLEFMSTSPFHELCKVWLALLVVVVAQEREIPYRSLGNTTWRKKKVKRGLEADDCFYIGSVQAIVGKTEIDLSRDPPPDLAIEIDISPSSLDRQSIYARLRVGEIWRWDGESLRVYQLQTDGEYAICERSPSFPFLDLSDIPGLLRQAVNMDDLSLGKLFRQWVATQGHGPEHAAPKQKKPKR